MIKVFLQKSFLSQSLVKNELFIKKNDKICIFSTVCHYFDHIYKGISLNFDEKFNKCIKFTIRMHKMYLKLNFIPKNSHF